MRYDQSLCPARILTVFVARELRLIASLEAKKQTPLVKLVKLLRSSSA
jgi:hypothetical protein